jgi:hypothetical protein
MNLIGSPTEITTSATDAVLAVECIVVLGFLWRSPTGDRRKIGIWCWTFGLLAFASLLGAVAHGLEMPPPLRIALWKPLYLSLGLLIALFLVGAIFDWYGPVVAMRLVPWTLGVGFLFFGLTELFKGAFIIFVIYEAAVMAGALAVYTFLAATRRLQGAGVVATAIIINLVAAGVQASSVSFTTLVPFDHNGVFHLIQMGGLATLGIGLRMSMLPKPRPT